MDPSRELLHQVKNHLAVYSSLLRLTRASLKEPGERLLLDKMEVFFSVFAQVYQRLHHEQRLSEDGGGGFLKAGPYLRDMIEVFRLPPWNLLLESEIGLTDQTIQSRNAVPLGLILAQLLVSSGRYGDEPETRELSILQEAGQWRLLLKGGPLVLPEETELMVSALTVQLDGRVEPPVQGETAWSALFPLSLFSHGLGSSHPPAGEERGAS